MSEQTPKNTPQPETSRSKSGAGISLVLLALIVLLGGYFRFLGLNWDDYSALHPDERYLTQNLLPQIGGILQFTPDNEHFPGHAILTTPANSLVQSEFDVQANTALSVGVVRNEMSQDIGRWWVGRDRIVPYANADTAHQALMRGDVDVVLLSEIIAPRYVSTTTAAVSTLDSIRVQEIRCAALHPDTDGAGGYFDTYCSPLNPHNAYSGSYAYGTLPLFMTHFGKDIAAFITQPESGSLNLQEGVLLWRFFSALFDAGAIIVIFFLGSRMHNRWVGLMAALLYACAPLAIQKAHFGTVNAITAFFVTLALWAAVNVQDKGKFYYYAVFGFALGSALAGRINVIPLAGVVVLAGMVNAAPVLDSRIAWVERERLLWRNIIGVFIAGITTVLVFRVFNPYAFTGPTFFHMIPNMRWLADAQGSSFAVSGASDAPPNWQWLARLPFLYPLRDMLFWGMGITMGVMAWFGFTWSGLRLVRGAATSTRNILIFAWVFVYFAWIGDLWVMTMRYYLPLYSALALFAAWALFELYQRAKQNDSRLTRVLLIVFGIFFAVVALIQGMTTGLTATGSAAGVIAAALILIAILPALNFRAQALAAFVLGFTVLWGTMFSNIYQHQLTRVQAARWASEFISGDFSMQIEGAPEGTPLVNIGIFNRSGNSATTPADLPAFATRLEQTLPYLTDFTATATGTVSTVYAPHIGDPLADADAEVLYISVATADTLDLLGEATLTADFAQSDHVLGDAYEIEFETPIELVEGQRYTFKVEALSGPIITGGSVMLTEGQWDDRITTAPYCDLPDGLTWADDVPSGLVPIQDCNGQTLARALMHSYDLLLSWPVDEQLKYDNFVDALEFSDYIAITSNRFYDTETRNPMRFPMTTAYYDALFSGELGYELAMTFTESYEWGPFRVNDQYLPTFDASPWLNELEADEAFHVYDHPAVFIFRKTEAYDQANTELILGVPLRRTDQIGLSAVPVGGQIAGVIYTPSLEANEAPTSLMQPAPVRETNRANGTWSERFDSDSLLNTNQAIGVFVWWMTVILMGVVTFPILFSAFPNLADRGYGFAKILGMLLVGWLAWFASNLRVPLWSQGGLLLLFALLTAFSAYLVYQRRDAFVTYLRDHWERLLIIEIVSAVLFLSFVFVRLSNPDLWHHPMGGEKPMDFAYFNAVLRTTVFPAFDPWFAGGNLNYYYFGYVIVGVPTLLLKIVPSFAYNLLVPTIFSVTGIGAFSVAFNIVDAWSNRSVESFNNEKVTVVRRMGNPYVAGFAALLLCVVLGNLDTPRVVIEEGVARLGGFQRPTGLEDYLVDQYIEQNGVEPDAVARQELRERAERGALTDEIAYEWGIRADLWSSFWRGLGPAMSGQPLPMGSNRWYWAPTRVIMETPGVGGNAIAEMPIFTFVYGDLHAHMISMPLMLFAMVFIFHEVLAAGRDERTYLAIFLSVFLGALSIGMMRATNTWDWPSFMLLAIVGLGYAWWRRWQDAFDTHTILQSLLFTTPIIIVTGFLSLWLIVGFNYDPLVSGSFASFASSLYIQAILIVLIVIGVGAIFWFGSPLLTDGVNRHSLADMVVYIGGFITLATFVVFPYNYWFGSTYNSLLLWEGNQTPLWIYFHIHGLFLFLITSLLIWETARWMRETHVRALRGRGTELAIGAAIVSALIVVAVVMAFMGNQVALIVIPLIVWIAILFFRPEQAVPMQYILVLAGFALSLTLGVEIVVLDGDIGRQNTVFKFYIQAWLIFSVVGGAAFAWLVQRADLWRFRVQLMWFIPLMLMVAAAAMYPVASVRARMVDRFVPTLPATLDGLDYMEQAQYYLPETGSVITLENDYHIIRWLQENVEGTPVIMEGRGAASEYHYNGRIAINTGLPSVLGWRWHQIQQRTIAPLGSFVQQRESNIKYFYETRDISSAVTLLRYYDVQYIIASDMERTIYPQGMEKLDRMVDMGLLSIAYERGVSAVYQVDQLALDTYMANQNAFDEAVGIDFTLLPAFVASNTVLGHVPNTAINVDEALQVIAERDMQHIVVTNPPRVIQFQPDAYDRIVRLEALGVLQRIDDSEGRRTYRVNQETLQTILDEENQ